MRPRRRGPGSSFSLTRAHFGEGGEQTLYFKFFAFFAGRAKAAMDFCGVFGHAAT